MTTIDADIEALCNALIAIERAQEQFDAGNKELAVDTYQQARENIRKHFALEALFGEVN